jgi:hypothetical protein
MDKKMDGNAQEYMTLHVPAALYVPMVKRLAELMDDGQVATEGKVDADAFSAKVKDLIKALKNSGEIRGAARAIYELAAERPGEWIGFDEALERSGVSHYQGQADIRRQYTEIGRLNGQDYSPLQYKKVAGGRVMYRLSDEHAHIWNSI